jgi:hypothetical protein
MMTIKPATTRLVGLNLGTARHHLIQQTPTLLEPKD